ncbi:MAG TPA: hypothetical protein DCQ31_14820 [Bacteroidales bacterium]|nr:hypothetical protein [Bacteroidales bacterium]
MKHESKQSKALWYFSNDFNCAQSVSAVFANELSVDADFLLRISNPLGGGIARNQLTCGALTGALLVLGMKYGKGLNDDNSKRDFTYDLSNELMRKFEEINGSKSCKTLLNNYDMNTEAGKQAIAEKDLRNKVCTQCVSAAVNILEELMNKKA